MTYDLENLYQFLTQTPESGLRKILVDNKPMSDVHFNILMKVTRSCKCSDFASHFEKGDFPKVKFSTNENTIKEKFWNDVTATLLSRGLLTEAAKKAA